MVIITASMLAMLGMLGCDDDEGGAVSSGINSSKQLDELSQAEEQRMCEEFASALEDIFTKETGCKIIAVEMGTSANNSQLCQSTYDGCMNGQMADVLNNLLGEIVGEMADCTPDDSYEDESECNATVGEAEKCANDTIAAFKAALKQLSCDNLGSFQEPEEPASCEVLDQKCSGFTEDENFDDF